MIEDERAVGFLRKLPSSDGLDWLDIYPEASTVTLTPIPTLTITLTITIAITITIRPRLAQHLPRGLEGSAFASSAACSASSYPYRGHNPHAHQAAVSLLRRLLRFDPSARASAVEALRDPWMAKLHDEGDLEVGLLRPFPFDAWQLNLDLNPDPDPDYQQT